MTLVLEADAAHAVKRATRDAECLEVDAALETIIAAHRQALVELAPHQRERSVRVDTGWHMEELGLLLGLRDRTAGSGRKEDRKKHNALLMP